MCIGEVTGDSEVLWEQGEGCRYLPGPSEVEEVSKGGFQEGKQCNLLFANLKRSLDLLIKPLTTYHNFSEVSLRLRKVMLRCSGLHM